MASIPHIIPEVQSEPHIGANEPVKPNSSSSHHTNMQGDTTTNKEGGGIFSGATESLATVGETAKQYIPTSVMNTLQNVGVVGQDKNATLPSQETRFSGSSGGVGTLPGRPSEPGVAKLPEERKLEEEVGHPLGREGILNTVAEEKTIGLAESLALDRKKREPPTAGTATAAKFINLDAIPTPDETPAKDHTHHETELAMNKPLPPSGNDVTYAKEQSNRQAPKTEPTGHATDHATGHATGHATSHTTGHTTGHASQSAPEHKSHAPQKKDTEDRGHMDSKKNSSESGKPSLSQKIKGEVKVLTGKLASNPTKVEAGQALKKGTST